MTDFRPRRIAIVEDEAVNALDLRRRVEILGHTVTATISSAREALETFENERPDLVLMDIVLEGEMDGIEAAEIIRSRWHVPVVFISAHADTEHLQRAKFVMPFGYLLKPVQDRDLGITIEMALYVAAAERSRRFLYEISSVFLESDSLEKSLSRLPILIAEHFEAPFVGIELYDEHEQKMVLAGSTGIDMPPGEEWRFPVNQTFSGTVATTGEAVLELDINQRDENLAEELRRFGAMTFACVPLKNEGRVVGTLAVADRQRRPDIVAEVDLLHTVANNLAQEIERRRYQAEYRLLVDNAKAGFVLFDTMGRYLMMNRNVANLLGGRPEDFVGKTLTDVLPEVADLHLARFARIAETRQGASFQDRFDLPGGPRWISSHLQPVVGLAGKVTGIQIVTIDITEQREAIERYRHLFESMTQGVVIQDDQGRIVEANQAACEILGLSMDQLLGKTPYDPRWQLIREDGSPHDPAEMPSSVALRTGQPVRDFLCGIQVPERGEHRWILIASTPHFRDGEATPYLTMTVFTDVTRRRRAELKIRENATRHQSILSTAMDGFWLADLDGRLLEVNTTYCDMSGYTEAELLTMKISDIDALESEPDFQAHARLVVAAGEHRFETRHRRKDGSEFDVEVGVQFQSTGEGRLIAFIRDISDRKQADEALRASENRLKNAQVMAKVGNWEYDVTSGRVWGSEQAFRIYGLERRSEFLPLDEVESHIVDAGRVNQALVDLLAGEADYDIEFQIQPGNREELITVRSVADLIRNENGSPTKVIGVIQDITDLRRLDEERRKTEETHRTLLTGLNAGVVVHAPDTSIKLTNPAACRLLGLSEEQIMGTEAIDPQWRFLRDDGSEMPLDEYPVSRVLSENGSVRNMVVGVRQQHGSDVVWVLANGYPEYTISGDLEHVVITFVDITDRKKAEETLRQSESDLRASQRIAHVGSWRLDLETNEVTWTEELYKMYGFDPKLPPPPYTEHQRLFTARSWERLSTSLARTRETGVPYELELEMVREDGRKGWMWVRGEAVTDSTGKTVGLWGAAQDITDRKNAEEELRESEERFHAMFDKHHAVMLLIEPESGAIIDANEAAQSFYGYSYEAFRKLTIQDVNTRAAGDVATLRKHAAERHLSRFIFPHRLSNGEIRTVEVHSSPVTIKGQSILFSIIHDITDRERAEEALRHSEAKFREFADMLPQVVFETDVEGNLTFVNQGAFATFGYTEEDLKAGLTAFQMVAARDRERATQRMSEIMTGVRDPVGTEYVASTKDGTEFPVLIYSTRFFRNEEPAGLRGIVIDITDRKRAEAETAQLQEQLAQAQKLDSIGRLAGGVAHDFNNMMGVVLGHVEMAMDKLDPTQAVHANLLEINKAAERATELTGQLLTFARKQTVTPKIIDCNETVAAMLTMLRRLIGEDIRLEWRPGADVGHLRMDPSQLDQILANLCVNARDAISGTGRIVIDTSRVVLSEADCAIQAEFESGEYIQLVVCDDGCGIDEDRLENIFDPFFTTKGIGKGTGLGLATVYGIVKQNKGVIEVLSEPGQGTTFKISLPRYQPKTASIAESATNAVVAPGSETILLVEDERPILEMTVTILKEFGYKVLAARNPVEAIEMSYQHTGRIDLLLTDVVMPEMNGRDLAKKLLSIHPDIKTLFMSGYTADVIAHHGVLDEGVQFIQKPFGMRNLSVKIRQVLDRR